MPDDEDGVGIDVAVQLAVGALAYRLVRCASRQVSGTLLSGWDGLHTTDGAFHCVHQLEFALEVAQLAREYGLHAAGRLRRGGVLGTIFLEGSRG